MTKIKNYKPGQLLTIRGRVYRVKHAKRYEREFPSSFEWDTCDVCDARYECFKLPDGIILCTGMPEDCYLQLVVPKSPMG